MKTGEGHKRDADATRRRILAAAQETFSRRSYGDAGIRDVADVAGTSSTLLLRYFGSKAALFEAALIEAMPLATDYWEPSPAFGRHVAQALLREGESIVPEAMVALAVGDSEAAAIAARVIEERGITPLADLLGPPDGRARALEFAMLINGATIYAKQLPLRPMTPQEARAVEDWLAAAIQAVFDRTSRR